MVVVVVMLVMVVGMATERYLNQVGEQIFQESKIAKSWENRKTVLRQSFSLRVYMSLKNHNSKYSPFICDWTRSYSAKIT